MELIIIYLYLIFIFKRNIWNNYYEEFVIYFINICNICKILQDVGKRCRMQEKVFSFFFCMFKGFISWERYFFICLVLRFNDIVKWFFESQFKFLFV